MKALLFILCLTATYACGAQGKWDDSLIGRRVWMVRPLPLEDNNIVYSENVALGGYSKERLFKNALDWYNYNYKTGDTRLTVENSDKGTIAGTGVIRYSNRFTGAQQNIFFSLSIQITSAGYNYRIYDIYSAANGEQIRYSEMYREELHPTRGVKERWTHKYRYESLSDMDTFITLAVNQFKKDMQK